MLKKAENIQGVVGEVYRFKYDGKKRVYLVHGMTPPNGGRLSYTGYSFTDVGYRQLHDDKITEVENVTDKVIIIKNKDDALKYEKAGAIIHEFNGNWYIVNLA